MALLFLTLAVFASALTGAETPAPIKAVSLDKCAAPPVIDGALKPDEWQCARKLELNYQVLPGDNAQPSERTEVFIAYDTRHLYLAFHAFDREPAAIRARMARRDNVFDDDYVAVFLDTFNDRRRAYALYFNPFGVQADGVFIPASLTNTTPANASEIRDLTWDGIFTSKGALTDDGYVVEVAIPFKTLRFQGGKEMAWGLHLHRLIPRKPERIYWQPLSRDQSELLAQMGALSGMQAVFAGRTLDLTPTLTGSITTDRAPALSPATGARFINKGLLDPGVTATWTVTPNLTFSGAINPDFSQIEADVPQIDANQRFPLFYPERRPFFLEGDDVFRSPGALTFVFTRQIVDPDWGAKLTGKIGRNTIGLLSASDRAPGLRVAATDNGFGENAQFNLVRYQRDVLRDSRVGAFALDRRWAGASNTVLASDGQIRFRGVNTIGWQAGFARTRFVAGEESKQGFAGYIWYEHRGRHWRVFTNNLRITPDYRAQTGFVRRAGINQTSGNYGYEFQPKEKSWWVSVRPFIVPRLLRTDDGRIDESYADPGADLRFARGVSFYAYHSWKRDSFAGRNFRYQAGIVNYTLNSFKKITFDGRVQFGEAVLFDPRNPAIGRNLEQSHTITWRPNGRFNNSLLYLSNRITDKRTGARLLRQDILRNRTTYQFSQAHSFRSLLDFDTARRQFGAGLLYAYEPRPNTAFFFGYNDLLFNAYDPLERRRAPGAGFLRQRRTVFFKLSYNFRF
jgi:hypothetical protein